ncbi:MAG: response regulator [Flavobacterium sp.]|jgi:CheY-like chemotaxis protein|nr:response regulator [Flavobacterium sp.]
MKKISILHVEDNEGDVLLVKEAFENSVIVKEINNVYDGEKAIWFLNKLIEEGGKSLPNLIILDINLPKINGIEVLAYIKKHEVLKQIPVVILSTSSSKTDIDLSHSNLANYFITKPDNVDDFLKAATLIEDFWLQNAQNSYNNFG